jgi:predicted tellurium resistance membrane protein TerC
MIVPAVHFIHSATRNAAMEYVVALVALTAMEIVLGIDNIVFIAILTGQLPVSQQAAARRTGLALAMLMRIALLLTITWVLGLTKPIFHFTSLPIPAGLISNEIDQVSVKDLILLVGGLFLIWKSVHEIHTKVQGSEHERQDRVRATFASVIFQIVTMDIIFSLDSVITAVGMVRADRYGIWVMIAAIVLAVAVMLIFAGQVNRFVENNPTLKMLALSFLLLIGVMLVAEGIGTHFNKGYIYFAMAFALGVETLNLRVRNRGRAETAVAGPDARESEIEFRDQTMSDGTTAGPNGRK